jgi:hypothetical protein
MPDRIGPLSYTHRVCLSFTDLAGKYDIVTGEGFPKGFFSLTTFLRDATISALL